MLSLKENKNSTGLIVINGALNIIHNKYIIKKDNIDTKTTLELIGTYFFFSMQTSIYGRFPLNQFFWKGGEG